MQFRLANKTDIPSLVDLRLAYLCEDFPSQTAKISSMIQEQLPDYFHRRLGNDLLVFVCEEDARIVSTVFLLITEKPANPNFPTGLTGTVLNVYTQPQYRKRGYATRLMELAIREAGLQNLSYLELKATKAGLPLYRKLGFIPEKSKNPSMRYPVFHS
ncbi:MAG: GNAT family N-acetyltransferase [Eubacteriales bacterium]|nr:GNAT family N-acetyltransferase [Eubacteriales bacterium]